MTISVVTISFNQARFLPEAMDSVADTGAEHIVVDPGSTDGSRDIAASYNVQTLFAPDNGPADGLNKGFALATGDVFGYLNADDRYTPEALNFASDFFTNNPDIDCLFGAIRIIDAAGQPSRRRRTPDRFDLARYAEQACNVWCPSTFFRRAAFEKAGGFNVGNRTCWDGELAVDLALTGARFAYTNRTLGDFRVYPDSITGSGRLRPAYLHDRQRIREKIYAAGVPAVAAMRGQLIRLAYKFNPLRHVRYLTK